MLTLAQKERKKEYLREWRARNKERLLEKNRAYNKQWLESHKEQVAAKNLQRNTLYRQRHKDNIYQRQKKWREENREADRAAKLKHYLAHKERYAEYAKRYWREHQEQKQVHTNARRSRFKFCTPSWADRVAIRAIYRQAKKLGMSVDHIVPIQSDRVCGLHYPPNLQILLLAENIAKLNRSWPNM